MLGRVLLKESGCKKCSQLRRYTATLLEKKALRDKRRRDKEAKQLKNLENENHQKTVINPVLSSTVYSGITESGDKKDTQCPLPQTYSPTHTEAYWYAWWEKEGFFKPAKQPKDENVFSMVIPPPNVTGKLHLGHALTVALEDVLCRWHRMKGGEVLWVPGCDHAGIATQAVVERILQSRNITRHDLGREKFLEEVWKWKDTKEEEIYDQLRILGATLDWTRANFTLDPKFVRAVQEAFIRLHEKDIIYRKKSLINWSCQLQSTISDIEIDNKALEGRTMMPVPGYDRTVEFGIIHSFDYPLVESHSDMKSISVSTTRIETMLGDTAIAVHPDDPRYAQIVGSKVRHPLIEGLHLPIIADSYVDRDFGTGAVKITPAHDFNDFEIGLRHDLPIKNILDDKGNIFQSGNPTLDGKPRFIARLEIIKALEEIGLYRGKQQHKMSLPVCSRSGDIIEPRIKTQWFVRIRELAEKAIEAVQTGEIQIVPDTHSGAWNNWLTESGDWCISRQLWWGHRVPAYNVSAETGETRWISAHSEEEAREKATKIFPSTYGSLSFKQDEDVLDTWFSSALFPFATLGWPDDSDDVGRFYPLSVMETGYDLLFFWVARMVMMGIALTDKVPFKNVYLHTMVRDSQGRKMSKSLGNVIDPLQVIYGCSPQELDDLIKQSNLPKKEEKFALKERAKALPQGIPECGTDALRFYLCFNKNTGKDISLNVKGVVQFRFFCNKIWNAFKFLERHVDKKVKSEAKSRNNFRAVDLWILSRLSDTVSIVNHSLEEFNFSSAAGALYRFLNHDFTDFYLESCKPIFSTVADAKTSQRLTVEQNFEEVFDAFLRLLSPFMPYITEELWQRLPNQNNEEISIMLAEYPTTNKFKSNYNAELENVICTVREVIQIIRNMKQTYRVPSSKLPVVTIACGEEEYYEGLLSNSDVISNIAKCGNLSFLPQSVRVLSGCLSQNVPDKEIKVFLKLKGLIDVDSQHNSLVKRRKELEDKIYEIHSNANEGARAQMKIEEKLKKVRKSMADVDSMLEDFNQLK